VDEFRFYLRAILSLEITGDNKYNNSCNSTSGPSHPELQRVAIKTYNDNAIFYLLETILGNTI
jgi:hypothetical protein